MFLDEVHRIWWADARNADANASTMIGLSASARSHKEQDSKDPTGVLQFRLLQT